MLRLFDFDYLSGCFAIIQRHVVTLCMLAVLATYAPYLAAQTPPNPPPNTPDLSEDGFVPLNEAQGDILPELSAETQDIQARLETIDETLRLLSRQFEALPLANSLPVRNSADQEALITRLASIERQLQDLQSENSASGSAGAANLADGAGVAELADLRVRLTQIEDVMRALNGQIEQVFFNLTKLSERFEQVAADTEFRFQELELATRQGGGHIAGQSHETQVLGRLSAPAPVEQVNQGDQVALVGEAPLDGARALANLPAGQTPQTADEQIKPRDLYDSALDKLRMGAYDDAQVQLARFLQLFPKHKLAGNAQYWLGETHYVRRNFKAAAESFLLGYTDYAESLKAPDSLLKLGMTLIMMGEKSTGCDAFAELASRFPDASQPVIQRAEIERQRADCL